MAAKKLFPTIKWYGIEVPVYQEVMQRVDLDMLEMMEEDERDAWIDEEIDRCMFGIWIGDQLYISGRHYFYFNYCTIQSVSGGAIRPEWRQCDEIWFRAIDRAKAKSRGLVCPKRRRQGATWRSVADDLYDALFYPYSKIGINSENEKKTKEYFSRIKFMYDKLPPFLQMANDGGRSSLMMAFSKKVKINGRWVQKGNLSAIEGRAPSNTVWEGSTLTSWKQDEAGLLEGVDLEQEVVSTIPCLVDDDGITRAGYFCLFGTSGEMDKSGWQLKRIWDSHAAYEIDQLFIPGWMGVVVDKYGNDVKEEAIMKIMKSRKQAESDSRAYIKQIQMYPLDIDEAFMESQDKSVFNISKINLQINRIENNPPPISVGDMIIVDGHPQFVPNPRGNVKIFEHPRRGYDKLYAAGVDPVDYDPDAASEQKDLSESSMFVFKRFAELNGVGNLPVAEYTCREQDQRKYYRQAAALCQYYGCKMLIEKNKIGMINWLKENGYYDLIAYGNSSVTKLLSGDARMPGIHMTEEMKGFMVELIQDNIEDYYENICFLELLEQFKQFGRRNVDRVMAYGIALILSKYYSVNGYNSLSESNKSDILPTFRYKNVNGIIQRT